MVPKVGAGVLLGDCKSICKRLLWPSCVVAMVLQMVARLLLDNTHVIPDSC